jgi:lysophospholipase L1-like esterase
MGRTRQIAALGTAVLLSTMGLGALSPTGQAAPPPGFEAQPLKIVLLGDSYSAGNGARDANGDRDYYGPKDCYRSHSNWAEQYVDSLQAQGYNVTFLNRACSGGVTADLLGDRKMDDSIRQINLPVDTTWTDANQVIADADPCNTQDYPDEEYWKYEVTSQLYGTFYYRCTRYLTAQVNAIGPDTDLVLFTIGGNDIGFSDIVKQCFVPGPRSAHDCEEKIDDARQGLPGVHDNVLRILDTMRSRGLREDARVVLGGYPLLALDNGYDLTDGWFNKYNYQVADNVRALGVLGDQAQDQIVTDANVGHPGQVIHLAGVPDLFNGHEPDGSFSNKNPARWIYELFDTKIQLEWYHMNPVGHYEYAQLLSQGGDYGAGAATQGDGGDIDVVLLLDTTGSMGSSIDAVRQYATTLVDEVSASTTSARFALVTYRDQPAWTGDPSDYASRVDQGFTVDSTTIKNALNAVTVYGGGDWPESMYSGLMTSLDLPWRPGVKKVVIVLADAPPHDPEPVSGFTATDVILKAFAVDPAEVYLVDTGQAADGSLSSVLTETGGVRIDANSSADVAAAIMQALQTALGKPYAWINGPYVARVGASIVLDGSGSYAVQGTPVSYEWDFDGDGAFDQTTTSSTVVHAFATAYSGVLTLRVTDSAGRSSLATTHLGITDDGDETPSAQDNCPDIDNQGQEDYDGDGVGDMCDATPGWEQPDQDGVVEGHGGVGAWPFDGFRAPVDNLPVLNRTNAGQGIPVKFGLGGDRGLDIFATGSPSSRLVDCSTSSTVDVIETTTTSPSGLHYDAASDSYTYVWKTQKAWAGTCRMLTLALSDGSAHQALFQFK